jgi:site-specific DNA-methyltransferase (adenine-specific)
MGKRIGTKTSMFGSPGRINHESSIFYSRKLYQDLPKEEQVEYIENEIPPECINKIFCKSSEKKNMMMI